MPKTNIKTCLICKSQTPYHKYDGKLCTTCGRHYIFMWRSIISSNLEFIAKINTAYDLAVYFLDYLLDARKVPCKCRNVELNYDLCKNCNFKKMIGIVCVIPKIRWPISVKRSLVRFYRLGHGCTRIFENIKFHYHIHVITLHLLPITRNDEMPLLQTTKQKVPRNRTLLRPNQLPQHDQPRFRLSKFFHFS